MNKIIFPPIPDSLFIRGDVPMTKEEIRTLAIAKMRLGKDSTVIDIGAGTGSVTIECALWAPGGRVIAVEKSAEGVKLIRANAEKFMVKNIRVIHGEAPRALEGMEKFDRAFIGGAGGNLTEILEWVTGNIERSGIISVNAVTLDTVVSAADFFRGRGVRHEIIQASITRIEETGGHRMFRAQNPVFIITGEKE